MQQQHFLTLDPNYCSSWTVRDALREVIQNALDTHTQVFFRKAKASWEIVDWGKGLELGDFLIGRTDKGSTERGQFGEGLPLACLVFTRLGKRVLVRTRGREFTFEITHNGSWNSSLLAINERETKSEKGTKVFVNVTDKELAEAKSLFLEFQPKARLEKTMSGRVIEDPGKVYVQGIYIGMVSSVFGYDLDDKELVNRDRSAISHYALQQAVGRVLEGLKSTKLICRLLREAETLKNSPMIEWSVFFTPYYKAAWKRALYQLYGRKACWSSFPEADMEMLERHWAVVKLPNTLQGNLNSLLSSSSELINKRKAPKALREKDLAQKQQRTLRRAKQISKATLRELGLRQYPIRIFDQLEDDQGETGGFYNRRTEMIHLQQSWLTKSVADIVGVILHETRHGYGYSDRTREFENCLTFDLGKLAVMLYEKRS